MVQFSITIYFGGLAKTRTSSVPYTLASAHAKILIPTCQTKLDDK